MILVGLQQHSDAWLQTKSVSTSLCLHYYDQYESVGVMIDDFMHFVCVHLLFTLLGPAWECIICVVVCKIMFLCFRSMDQEEFYGQGGCD